MRLPLRNVLLMYALASAPAAAKAQQPALTPEQQAAALRIDSIIVTPAQAEIAVGEKLPLTHFTVRAVDASGAVVDNPPMAQFLNQREATLDNGVITAHMGGVATLVIGTQRPGKAPILTRVPIHIRPRPVARIDLPAAPTLYTGTMSRLVATAFSADGQRREAELVWTSTQPGIAAVDMRGFVRALKPGTASISVKANGVTQAVQVRVVANPVRSIELTPNTQRVLTGDVVRFRATARDAAGKVVADAPVLFTMSQPAMNERAGAAVYDDGSFVAEQPGTYRVLASVGGTSAEAVIDAARRDVRMDAVRVGLGLRSAHPTSDLWVFRGTNGRDYAYTGTHVGGQKMFAWDVTDPAAPVLTDSVTVDARVVNDVKVNAAGTLAVITREGASNRRNGIVVLDLADPAHPKIASEYSETLTGGVHNTFIVDNLVYAVNDGTLDVHIIDIADPKTPKEVGRWGIEQPGKYLHDIWVVDGIGYASYWDDGIYVLDLGKGQKGGSPTKPTVISKLAYRTRVGRETFGNTHSAFPYTNKAGKRYLFVGDEIFGCEECVNRSTKAEEGPRGYIHVLDMTDMANPVEVARYVAPEAGIHNFWVEDDKLYAAYYQAGLRVVDVSGELRGDLYEQGREIAWMPTGSAEGFVPNSPFAWGPQPYKGNVFVSDYNSGLWVVKLQPRRRDAPVP